VDEAQEFGAQILLMPYYN